MSKKIKENPTVKCFSLNGHSRPVRMVKYNRDGDMFFSCSDDKFIMAWDNDTAEKVGVYQGKGACRSLAISKNTEYVVGSYRLEGVLIFNAMTGDVIEHIKTTDKYKAEYVEFSYGDKELLVLKIKGDQSKIEFYDFSKLLKGDTEPIRILEFDEEVTQSSYGYLNEKLYLSTTKGKILIVDTETGEIQVDAKIHPGNKIFSFSFSKDFSMLASWGNDNQCKLMHPDTLEIIKVFDKESPWRCCTFSTVYDIDKENDKYHIIIGGGQDAKDVTTTNTKEGSFESRLYSIIYEEELSQITGHFGPVHSMEWSPDGRGFVSASEDGTVRLQRFPIEYLLE